MEYQSHSERFQDIMAALDEWPPGFNNDIRNQLLDELDYIDYAVGLRQISGGRCDCWVIGPHSAVIH